MRPSSRPEPPPPPPPNSSPALPLLTVLSGAGISAESGVRTFRDNDGLWEDHRIEDVATPAAWARDPGLVNAFYNARRRQLDAVEPNAAHLALARAERHLEVQIVTQNVDDLHERAGSTRVLHLHGELRKVRSSVDAADVRAWSGDLSTEDRCGGGLPLRPHIVWFGEQVPELTRAAQLVARSDYLLIVGTSLQVYPAAGLLACARPGTPVTYVDPYPATNHELAARPDAAVVAATAAVGVPTYVDQLIARLA